MITTRDAGGYLQPRQYRRLTVAGGEPTVTWPAPWRRGSSVSARSPPWSPSAFRK